uniref:mitochondrial antiviral-signaling protein n=1 Tax=Euleptes europaea TaxID=460621 RepID=UPI002541E3F3|nr:mitochondrial antiviral-signaling protein [Euleptes europaea]
MGFVEDKVKEYIQGNYAKFQDLRLNQMLLHLPCLTAADRQEILRETDRNGNISSLIEFFNRLWCRRGWVTQLISALRETNSDLADSIQEVYEAHLLPSQRRPPASSPSAVAPVAVPQGANAPPSDNSPLSLPRSQSRPTGDQPPKATNALTPEPSASLQDVVDYRAPVQETKCPSWNDKTAIEGKALGKDIKQKISTPGQHNRNAAESNASLAVQRENLTDVQVASPAALVRHHEHLREVSEEDRQSTEPVSSESDAETPQTASSLGRSFSESSPFPPRSSIKEHVDQIPNTVPVGRFSSPPFNFAGSSSTDVIPPSSPVAVSSILSDGYSEDLKAPVQERELAKTNLWTTSERITGDASLRATIASPSSVTDSPTNSREKRNNAGGPSRDARIFYSNREEEDISLFKPGVLSSEEVTGGPLDRLSINPGRVYSGTSDRLRMSDEYSEKSDPLMLSASTWSSHSEESGRNLSTGTNINHSDEDSIRTHTVHVRESPSADLAGAPQITRPALGNASQSPGDSLDSVAGDQLIKNASSPPVRNDSQRNSLQNESVSDTASSHMSGSVLLAVGFALISLVALVVYKQVKK